MPSAVLGPMPSTLVILSASAARSFSIEPKCCSRAWRLVGPRPLKSSRIDSRSFLLRNSALKLLAKWCASSRMCCSMRSPGS